MEDNDKRNSSVPGASSSSGPGSSAPGSDPDRASQPDAAGRRGGGEQDMFDPHEQTLPRFTIDPGEAAPLRQRTRTLLGVPTLVSEDAPTEEAAVAPEAAPAANQLPEPPAQPAKVASSILDAAPEQSARQAYAKHGAIDITVDVVEDDLNEVTMVSDADVVALPDNTGQLQPVRFEPDPDAAIAAAVASKREREASEAAAAAAPVPNSLAPREIARGAAAKPPQESSTGRGGALLVAAVMLLATGAWFLTAGSFRRTTLSTDSTQAATAAATQPVNNSATDKKAEPPEALKAPTPAPEAVSAAPATPAVAAPAPTTPTTPTTPAPTTADDSAAPGLKNKPALTAAVRGERVARKSRKTSAAPAPTGDLPLGPTRADVVARLESVRPAVHACAAGRSGVADLDVTIAHTGVVMHVLVGGDFAGTTEGSCIARAVRQARFPAFKQERFRLLYPYAM